MSLRECLDPFHTRRVRISSPHAVSVCIERLREGHVPSWAFWNWRPGLKGKVTGERFALYQCRGKGEGFPSEARGRFEPDGRGTRLELTIGWRRLNVFVYAIASLGLAWWYHRNGVMNAWSTAAFLLMALVIGAFGRAFYRNDAEWLVGELCDLLDGEEVPGAL